MPILPALTGLPIKRESGGTEFVCDCGERGIIPFTHTPRGDTGRTVAVCAGKWRLVEMP
jgi:hypothetical protein